MAGWRDGGALEGGYWPTPSRAGAFRNNTVKIRRTNEANFWTVNIDADGRFFSKLVLRQVRKFSVSAGSSDRKTRLAFECSRS